MYTTHELVDFCLTFCTMKGFVDVIEQNWQEFDCAEQLMEATYEATELLNKSAVWTAPI